MMLNLYFINLCSVVGKIDKDVVLWSWYSKIMRKAIHDFLFLFFVVEMPEFSVFPVPNAPSIFSPFSTWFGVTRHALITWLTLFLSALSLLLFFSWFFCYWTFAHLLKHYVFLNKVQSSAIIMNTSMIILIAFLIILITIMAITNLEEYVGPHTATDVVLGDSVVDVRPVRMVDDLAWHE